MQRQSSLSQLPLITVVHFASVNADGLHSPPPELGVGVGVGVGVGTAVQFTFTVVLPVTLELAVSHQVTVSVQPPGFEEPGVESICLALQLFFSITRFV